jgi:tRNA A37 threonylcarbamoyladenosine biosynthesis protein TsaE
MLKYLLVSSYDVTMWYAGPPVHHFDLYRLRGQDDLVRLDIGSALSTGVCLMEWPERLEQQTPAERLDIFISMISEVFTMMTTLCN